MMLPNKLTVAAWLLSLATDQARATTTVGDFSEESNDHGRTWFWCQIARTLGAHIAHDFTEAPLRLLLSAAAALVASIAAYYLLVISWARIMTIWLNLYVRLSGEFPSGVTPGMRPAGITYLLTAHIAFGVCMARLSRHPLPLWTVWSILWTIPWIVYSISAGRVISYPISSLLFVLIGVIWQRRLSLRAA